MRLRARKTDPEGKLRKHMETHHHPYDDAGRVSSEHAYRQAVHAVDHMDGTLRIPHEHEEADL